MNIEIGKIETEKNIIDKAFRRGKTKLDRTRIKNRRMKAGEKYRHLEAIRYSVIKDSIYNDLSKILEHMPHYFDLTDFYQEIFDCFIDVNKYKKALGSVKWAIGKINSIYKESTSKTARNDNASEIVKIRNVFLARCSSVLKQINSNLIFLEEARRTIKEIPSIKSDMFTVAITGFPNVGKSTLLGKITSSQPEVNSYPFTTKGLMIGYIKTKKKGKQAGKESEIKIQVIDTPGTLNRFNKMNKIEKMAHLCMKKSADLIVYVLDLTEEYPIDDQINLYENIKKLNKEMLVYFSKSDIIDKKKIESFKIKGFDEPEQLKKAILKNS